MAKQLIIVESPAKVKTIGKFLGSGYKVRASVGHVRDLPAHSLGVDESNGFAPQYEIIDKKRDVVNDLRREAQAADVVYLAPDPDREGEAIAWHVAELIKDKAKIIKRIQFNEITERAVREALAHPRELDNRLFDAQQARRILDRLVGYKISPLLWKNIKRGISAGRVQSVALRLIVEREREREAFVAEEFWPFYATLSASAPPSFRAELIKINGKKAKIDDKDAADAFKASIADKPFVVEAVERKERTRSPAPPFITSSLQQAANQKLGYGAQRTMRVAQKLYEGVELGDKGVVALITYMRTDSTRVAEEAKEAVKNFIVAEYGENYLPPRSRVYKTGKSAQDAHEAIRPVDVNLTPEMARQWLAPDQYNVYRLIWTRFVASQMASAKFNDTVVFIKSGEGQWRAKGEETLFDGFLKVRPGDEDDAVLPELKVGETLKLEKLETSQKFTQPPARYSEATLVKELEEKGIGRPSTYAAIISTLQDREYARLEDKRLAPTDLGRVVCERLVENFERLMDVGFTAKMEEGLDKVAEGDENWVDLLSSFASEFNPTLEAAAANMQNVKKGLPADVACPKCGKPAVIKFGKAGPFLACTGYPACDYTSNFSRDEQGKIAPAEKKEVKREEAGTCPQCGRVLLVRKSRAGSRFIGCSGYPDCRYVKSFPTGVACPACGEGQLVEKSGKTGRVFYGCDNYPKCKFLSKHKPVPEACPKCGAPYLLEKRTRDGVKIECSAACGYEREG